MSNRTPGRPTAHPARAGETGRAAEHDRPAHPRELPAAAWDGPAGAARLLVLPSEPSEHLFRRLLSAYLAGAASFEISERPRLSPATRQVVREFCRRTRGPEIVRDRGGALEIGCPDAPETDGLDARLQRLGRLVLDFHREAEASWDDLPLGDDHRWSRRDDEVDREAWYLERCLALGLGGRAAASAAWTVARSLERIADHAVTLGEIGPRLVDLRSDGATLRELRQFHRQAMAHLAEVLEDTDGARANELLDVGEALLASGGALAERLLPAVGDGSIAPASAVAVARALEAVGRTVAYAQDIAQAFFDRAFQHAERPAGRTVAEPTARVAPDPVLAAGTAP